MRTVWALSVAARPLLAVAAVLSVGGCTAVGWRSPERPADRSVVEQGRRLVKRDCAGCHGQDAPARAQGIDAPPFWSVASRHDEAELRLRLSEIAAHGHGEMPPIYMTPEEIRLIAAYIHQLRFNRGPEHPI